MAQAINQRALTADARVRSRSVHVRFVVYKMTPGTVFSDYFGFHLSVSGARGGAVG